MSKVKMNGGALLCPAPPAMVSCVSPDGKPNIITVAWTGICCTHPPKTYISVRPERYSYDIIKETGEFVINLTSDALVRAADFCGMHTGRKVDKFEKCALTPVYEDGFSAPIIEESPLSLCCKVSQIIPLGSHDMFLSDIVSVYANDDLFDKNGRLCLERAGLVSFSHGQYFEQGKKLGEFGFSVAKKKKRR